MKIDLKTWLHPYSTETNIFDIDGIFPDLNDVCDEEDAEQLADLLIETYIESHMDVEPSFRDELIKKLERDWDRLVEFRKDK